MIQDYRVFLQDILQQRKKRNLRYSLRSFARDLHISPSHLSDILSKKRMLSIERAKEMLAHLQLVGERGEIFQDLVILEKLKGKKKLDLQKKIKISYKKMTTHFLQEEKFKMISHFHYFVILEILSIIQVKKSDVLQTLSQLLNVQHKKIQEYLQRLIDLDYLEENQETMLQVKTPSTKISCDHPNKAVQNFHRSLLEKGLESFDLPFEERVYNGLIFSTDQEGLEKLKKKLKEFAAEYSINTIDTSQKKQVYSLAWQLLPLSQSIDKIIDQQKK